MIIIHPTTAGFRLAAVVAQSGQMGYSRTMLVLGSFTIFLAAVSLIGLGSIWAIRFAGMAMNRNRPLDQRRAYSAAAAGAIAGIVASAAGGIYGIFFLWYAVQKHALATGAGG
jgi:hypothetical protein